MTYTTLFTTSETGTKDAGAHAVASPEPLIGIARTRMSSKVRTSSQPHASAKAVPVDRCRPGFLRMLTSLCALVVGDAAWLRGDQTGEKKKRSSVLLHSRSADSVLSHSIPFKETQVFRTCTHTSALGSRGTQGHNPQPHPMMAACCAGAMVGGPNLADQFRDVRSDYHYTGAPTSLLQHRTLGVNEKIMHATGENAHLQKRP